MDSIAVFARPPVTGRVKTRLSPALPAGLACGLYRAMLADALAAAAATPAGRRAIYWAEPPSGSEGVADPVVPAGFEVRAQRGADLGERLSAAFAELLGGSEDRAVILGGDCPELSSGDLAAAFAALERHDVALGPSADGGYWAIGLRRAAPALFRGIAWSTSQVLEQTQARAHAAGLRVARLETRHDLDTPADLIGLVARLAVARASRAAPGVTASTSAGAHTRRALEALGMLPGAASDFPRC
jgi:hypothetical protein